MVQDEDSVYYVDPKKISSISNISHHVTKNVVRSLNSSFEQYYYKIPDIYFF